MLGPGSASGSASAGVDLEDIGGELVEEEVVGAELDIEGVDDSRIEA